MKKLFLLLAVASLGFAGCDGDPSTERDYNQSTTTGGDDPTKPEYDQKNDVLKDSINRSNSGTINNDPNGVNTVPKDNK
jgi:hypothetical protein